MTTLTAQGGGAARLRHLLRSSDGMVTAEFAITMLALAPIIAAMLMVITAGAQQVRVLEAARTAARMLARGDTEAAAKAQIIQVMPQATLTTHWKGKDVVVSVVQPVDPIGPLPSFTITGTAVTPVEDA